MSNKATVILKSFKSTFKFNIIITEKGIEYYQIDTEDAIYDKENALIRNENIIENTKKHFLEYKEKMNLIFDQIIVDCKIKFNASVIDENDDSIILRPFSARSYHVITFNKTKTDEYDTAANAVRGFKRYPTSPNDITFPKTHITDIGNELVCIKTELITKFDKWTNYLLNELESSIITRVEEDLFKSSNKSE